MRLIQTSLLLFVLALCFGVSVSAASDDRDTITRADNRTVKAYIQRETVGELIYSSKKEGGSEQSLRWKDVKRFAYNGMSGGVWTIPEQAMYDGDYETAFKQFRGLAGLMLPDGGDEWTYKEGWEDSPEWKRAYGLYHMGLASEALGKRADAVTAYERILEKLPQHRLALYAAFRLGVNQALLGGDTSQADAAIKAFAGGEAASKAGEFERGLEAVKLAAKDDMTKATREARRLNSRFRDDIEDWIAWRELWGAVLIEKGEAKEAVELYQDMYEKMASNPRRRARANFLYADALDKAGEAEKALYQYLRLDVLPILGKADLAQARFRAAQIYVDRLDQLEGEQQVRIKELCTNLLRGVVRFAPGDSELILEAQTIIDEKLTEQKPGEAEEAEAEAEDGEAAAEEQAE